jgi:hypothetical protein
MFILIIIIGKMLLPKANRYPGFLLAAKNPL